MFTRTYRRARWLPWQVWRWMAKGEWNAEESMLSLCMGGDSAEVVHVHDHNTTPGDRSWWPPCGSLTPLAESWWPPCGSLTHPFRELVSAVMIGVEGEGGDDGWLPKMAGGA